MARILMVVMSVILMGCASGTPINDFSTRSVVYGWLDIGQVSGNRLVGVSIRNTRTGAEEQYYDIGWEKLDGGYLIWHNGVQPGQYEFNKIQTMACLGVMCGNTINEYEFGALGSAPGKVTVRSPGVYSMGKYTLKTTRRGFFRPGEFDIRETVGGPSRREMLGVMVQYAPEEHPVVAQRIQRAMAQ
ncbi:MAG: hypothetical protein KJO78_15490 [Alphaproteobacteria bacterium]|jgi:hypothetical protein|nr:hypothetical protein [Alphaproteobacteria bacterium]